MAARGPSDAGAGITTNELRLALRSLSDARALADSPLTRLKLVTECQRKIRLPEGWLTSGLALQAVLGAAITALASSQQTVAAGRILTKQYVERVRVKLLAEELGISERTFFLEQNKAIETLRQRLLRDELAIGALEQNNSIEVVQSRDIVFSAPPRPAASIPLRDQSIQEALRMLQESGGMLIALQGGPGAGKSTIAARIAHDRHVLTTFPDGVLWAGLGPACDLAEIVQQWELAFGLPSLSNSGNDIHRRIERLRAHVGMRRLLIILDDVWLSDVVQLLRLGGPTSACLMTTRSESIAAMADRTMSLSDLEPGEIRLLLAAESGLPAAVLSESFCLSVANRIGASPLLVHLAARQLRRLWLTHGGDQDAFLSAWRADGAAVIDDQAGELTAAIERSCAVLSQETQGVLAALARLASKPALVPESLIVAVARLLSDEVLGAGLYDAPVHIDTRPLRAMHQSVSEHLRKHTLTSSAQTSFHSAVAGLAAGFHDALRELVSAGSAILGVLAPHINPVIDLLISERRWSDVFAICRTAFDACLESGRSDLANRLVQAAVAAGEHLPDNEVHAQIDLWRAYVVFEQGDLAACVQHCQRGLAMVTANATATPVLLAHLHRQMGRALQWQGDEAGTFLHLSQSVRFAIMSDNHALRITTLISQAAASMLYGDGATAARLYDEAAGLQPKIGSRAATEVLFGRGYLACHQGRWSEALDCFMTARSHAQQAGWADYDCHALCWLGMTAFDAGHPEDAGLYFSDAIAIASMGDFVQDLMFLYQKRAEVFWRMDRREEAWLDSDRALALSLKSGKVLAIASTYLYRGRMLVDQGHLDQARAAFDEVVARQDVTLCHWSAIPAYFGLIELAERSKDAGAAARLTSEVVALVGRKNDSYSKQLLDNWLTHRESVKLRLS